MTLSAGLLFGIVAMLGWGLQDVFMSRTAKSVGGLRTAIWVQTFSFLIILAASIIFKVQIPSLSSFLILTAMSIMGVIAYIAFTKGLEKGNVSIVAPVSAGWGVVTAVIGAIAFKENITNLQIVCIAMVVIGTMLSSFDISKLRSHRKIALKDSGVREALVAAALWGVFFVIASYMVQIMGWFSVGLYIGAFSTVFTVLYAKVIKAPIYVQGPINYAFLLCAGALLAAAALGYNLGVSSGFTSIVAPVGAASPVITVLIGLTLLREKIIPNELIGVVLVMIGIVGLAS